MFLLIKNADVYAPEHIGINDLLICAGKIVRVAPKLEAPYPGTKVLDAEGRKLMPGLIDQHVHITGGGGESGFKSRIREISFPEIVRAGVTTLVGLLGTDGTTRSVEALVAKAKGLKEEGLTVYALTGSYEVPTTTLTGSVQRDMCFVEEIIGAKIAISDHRSSAPTREELARLGAQVRNGALLAGKPGVLCMHTGTGKARLDDVLAVVRDTDIPIRHFRPTHVGRLPDDAAEFSRQGGYVDFTSSEEPDPVAKKLMHTAASSPWEHITLSSDSNGSSPIWNEAHELIGMGVGSMDTLWGTVRHMIVNGMTEPENAIRLVTENVAKALDICPRKGSVSEGADADLMLTDDSWNIDTLLLGGRIVLKDKQLLEYGYYRY